MKKYSKSYIIIFASVILFLSACSSGKNVHFAKTTRLLYQEELRQLDDDKKAEEAYNHVLNGAKYKMSADYAMAIIEYQQALQYDSVAVVLSEIAECYNMLAYYGIASEYATKAIEKDPLLAEAYEHLSSALLMTYDSKGAIYAYKQYATLIPTDEHLFNLAKMYEISGYPDEALVYYQELSKRNNNSAIIKSMAYIYLGKQDTTRYLELSKEAYKLAPDQQDGIYDMLMHYMNQKDYMGLHSTLQDYSNYAASSVYNKVYGLTLEYLNDSLTTEEVPEIAPLFLNDIRDDMMETQYLVAYALLLSMRTEDSTLTDRFAEYGYNKFIETPYFATNAIIFYAKHENFNKVQTIAEKYIDIFPEDPYFYIMLSEAYKFCEEYDNSIAVLDEAMLYDSTNVNLLIQLGGTYHLMKDYASADSIFNKAIKMNPNNDIINNEYAYYLAERNDNLVYAHTLIQKALEKRPDNPSYLDTYGWVCYKMKNYSVALEYLGMALEKDVLESTMAVLYEHIGYVYRDKGENEKAIEVWNKAIEKGSTEEQTLLDEIEKLK